MRQIYIGPAEIETFLAVAMRGSFTRAADELGLSQPTVTGRIQRLEAVLGLPLFNRTTRRVELTEAGQRFRPRAEHAVNELRELVEHFHDEAALRSGRVSVTGTPAIASTVIPQIARRFLRRYPGVQMRLYEDFVLEGLHRLCEGEVDLAVAPVIEYGHEVEFEPLFSDEFLLIVPRDHPFAREESVELEALSRYPLLMRPAGSALRAQLAIEFELRGLQLKPALESTSLLTLLGLVEAGLGLSVLPATLARRLNLNAVAAVRVGGSGTFRQIGIATLQGRVLSPAAARLRTMLRRHYGTPRARPASAGAT